MNIFKNKNKFYWNIHINKKDNKMTNNLNKHFNSIGNNAVKNEETSIGIIEELV